MIRKAIVDDIDTIVKLEEETLGESLGRDMLISFLENPLVRLYVFEQENNILGYLSFLFDGLVVEIYNIAVFKAYQGRNIGTCLISFMIDLFKNDEVSYLLEVRASNEKAIHLYEKFGFKRIRVRKNYYKDEDAIVFEKRGL